MYNVQTNKKDIWNPHFYKSFPGFADVATIWEPVVERFLNYWPDLQDYAWLANQSYEFIDDTPAIQYEQSVFQWGKIPTRIANWHDFMNNLTWIRWPKFKRAIIEKAMQKPRINGSRSTLQNTLAHLDECGCVIASSMPDVFSWIKQHEWQMLFKYKGLSEIAKPYLIGHGILEKCLRPYIGLTAKAIFISVESSFWQWPEEMQVQHIDDAVAQFILSDYFPETPKSLSPFPVLGWPQWYADQNDEFFNNLNYFRPKQNTHQKAVV